MNGICPGKNLLFCLYTVCNPPANAIGSTFKIQHRIYHFPSGQLQLSSPNTPSSPYLDYGKCLLISQHSSVPHYSLFSMQQSEQFFKKQIMLYLYSKPYNSFPSYPEKSQSHCNSLQGLTLVVLQVGCILDSTEGTLNKY